MSKESVITLSIGESRSPPSFNFHVFVDGEIIAGNQSLSPDESKAMQEVSQRYNRLPREQLRPQEGDFLRIDLRFSIHHLPSPGSELLQFLEEADTLHSLATIDMERGEYEVARKEDRDGAGDEATDRLRGGRG